MLAQVQTRVKLRDLIGITIKHQRGLLGGEQAPANAPLTGLAPARMEAYTGGVWPPVSIDAFEAFEIPFLNTMILLTSGTTLTWAHHEVREGNHAQAIFAMWLTLALGVSFTALQAYEYVHAPFTFTGGIYGSTFFMATGFHGFHVIVGTLFLAVCQWRLYQGHFKPDHHFGFEAAAWYWHFVDVVWLFLFSSVYWWGGP